MDNDTHMSAHTESPTRGCRQRRMYKDTQKDTKTYSDTYTYRNTLIYTHKDRHT